MAAASRIASGLALGLAWAGMSLGAAAAQPRPTVFGGVGLGADRLAFVGATVPVGTARGSQGLALRGIVSGSQNRYDGAGGRVKSEQGRAEAALLYQRWGGWGYFDAGVGGRYTDTDLSPDDPGNPNRGSQWDPMVSVSGESARANPWQVAGFASYGFSSEDYYVRGELTRAVGGGLRLGVEAIFDGDPNYDRRRAGVVAAFGGADWQLRLAVGGADSRARDGAYGSVGVRRSF